MKKLTWRTEKRKLSELMPYDKNPRQLTKKQHADLTKSLKKFDLAEIPAINTDNVICAGHQRVMILKEQGNDIEIDVRVPSRKLTDKEFQEYNVRSNKNTGEWEFDILANEFEMPELIEWGFEEGELVGFDIKPDAFDGEKNREDSFFALFNALKSQVVQKLCDNGMDEIEATNKTEENIIKHLKNLSSNVKCLLD